MRGRACDGSGESESLPRLRAVRARTLTSGEAIVGFRERRAWTSADHAASRVEVPPAPFHRAEDGALRLLVAGHLTRLTISKPNGLVFSS